MNANEKYNGNCTVTELIFVRYEVDFRPGKIFCCSLKRMSADYLGQVAEVYCAENPGASVTRHQCKIISIQNGWR